MNNPISYGATQNQVIALRKFGVSEGKLHALSKQQASELLSQFIARIPNTKPSWSGYNGDVVETTRANLAEATKIVLEHFGLRDKSNLGEVHVALIQEVSRQIYGLKYWIGKTATRFD